MATGVKFWPKDAEFAPTSPKAEQRWDPGTGSPHPLVCAFCMGGLVPRSVQRYLEAGHPDGAWPCRVPVVAANQTAMDLRTRSLHGGDHYVRATCVKPWAKPTLRNSCEGRFSDRPLISTRRFALQRGPTLEVSCAISLRRLGMGKSIEVIP